MKDANSHTARGSGRAAAGQWAGWGCRAGLPRGAQTLRTPRLRFPFRVSHHRLGRYDRGSLISPGPGPARGPGTESGTARRGAQTVRAPQLPRLPWRGSRRRTPEVAGAWPSPSLLPSVGLQAALPAAGTAEWLLRGRPSFTMTGRRAGLAFRPADRDRFLPLFGAQEKRAGRRLLLVFVPHGTSASSWDPQSHLYVPTSCPTSNMLRNIPFTVTEVPDSRDPAHGAVRSRWSRVPTGDPQTSSRGAVTMPRLGPTLRDR